MLARFPAYFAASQPACLLAYLLAHSLARLVGIAVAVVHKETREVAINHRQ